MFYRPELDVETLYQDDEKLINLCNEMRLSLATAPSQSFFKVCCLLIISYQGAMKFLQGANSEEGYIGGAICAERSALVKLRFLDGAKVLKVVIVTDSELAVSPGLLCRQYLMSTCEPSTVVVLGNHSSSLLVSCSIGELLPFPYLYRMKNRNEVLQFAKSLAAIKKPFDDEEVQGLYDIALSCNKLDRSVQAHPISFSAAILFEDGSFECSWLLKGLEYGCSLDPVAQLVREMELRNKQLYDIQSTPSSKSCSKPKMVVMVDQLGVCHAPFAQSRALINEYGYGDLVVIVHDIDGNVVHVPAKDLTPSPPGVHLLTHDDFPCHHE